MMSRASRPFSLMVPPEIFLLVTQARMSFSEALVLRGEDPRAVWVSVPASGVPETADARRKRYWSCADLVDCGCRDPGASAPSCRRGGRRPFRRIPVYESRRFAHLRACTGVSAGQALTLLLDFVGIDHVDA